MDYESMTMAELEELKLKIKAEIDVKRSELAGVAEVYNAKVGKFHLNEAYFQLQAAAERDGRSVIDQAKYWLLDENADDPGHRIQAGAYLKNEGVL